MQQTVSVKTLIGLAIIAFGAWNQFAQPDWSKIIPWVVIDGGGNAPITEPGFRVLIVEETKERENLPKEQQEIIFATKAGSVADYCEAKCVKVNNKAEFRLLDKDDNMERESKIWGDAMKRAKETKGFTVPWLLVSNGKKGFEGPLPKTADETLAILKKYGE